MKRVLSFLLMIVFMHASVPAAFAKSGGPTISNAFLDTIGTYAGVMIPDGESNPDARLTSEATGMNSIGIFSLGVPQAGVADGTSVCFIDGITFIGTISGVVDPLDGAMTGIIDAETTRAYVDPDNPTLEFVIVAQGQLEAKIRQTASASSVTSSVFSFATTRLSGKAELAILGVDNTAFFKVEGFKQSSQVVQSNLQTNNNNNTNP